MQPDLADSVGGIMHMEYSHDGGIDAHPIRLAVVAFDPAPSGPDSDNLYTGGGLVVPTESGILATFAALGSLWAPYYPSSWSLHLLAVWQNVDGFPLLLPTTPAASPVNGSYSGTLSTERVVRRTLSLYSGAGERWRIWLQQMPGDTVGQRTEVSMMSGGIDVRDRAWYTYLSSGASGVVARDGTRFQPGGKVKQWWDRPSLAVGTGDFIVSG